MKVITLEVVMLVDDDFGVESESPARLVERAIDHLDEYDDQAMMDVDGWTVIQTSERYQDEED